MHARMGEMVKGRAVFCILVETLGPVGPYVMDMLLYKVASSTNFCSLVRKLQLQ